MKFWRLREIDADDYERSTGELLFTDREQAAFETLIGNLDLNRNPDFQAFADEFKEEVTDALRSDGATLAGLSAWHDFSRGEKEAFLRHVVGKTVEVFGIEPPTIRFASTEDFPERISGARTDEGGHRITFDLDDLRNTPDADVFAAAVEEAVHAYQGRLETRYWSGELSPDDPRFPWIELMALVPTELKQRVTGFSYLVLPADIHAKEIARSAQKKVVEAIVQGREQEQ